MTASRYRNPEYGDCDLVMEGGVTSGVVYPQAVLALAEKYRFRNVGGGSVGAVAAVLAAAAELGRERGGFEELEREQQRLVDEERFLLNVFQPSESTRPLMETLLDFAEARRAAALRAKGERKGRGPLLRDLRIAGAALVRNNPATLLAGAAMGAVAGGILGLVSGMNLLALVLCVLALAGLLGFIRVLRRLWRIATRTIPRENFYGICTGHDPDTAGTTRLTDWLSDVVNRVAG